MSRRKKAPQNPERSQEYYIERSRKQKENNEKVDALRETARQTFTDRMTEWNSRKQRGWLDLLNEPDGKERIAEILTEQAKKSDASTADGHADAEKKHGIEASATDRTIIKNSWTGEGQPHKQYQDYLAQRAGATSSGNVVEIDFGGANPERPEETSMPAMVTKGL